MPITPDATTAAYVAGLLDGDGCITISPDGQGGYWFGVRITGTDRGLADWLQATLGGSVQPRAARPPRRPAYNWTIRNRHAAALLQELSPDLRVKRREAEIAIAFSNAADPADRAQLSSALLASRPRRPNGR